MFYYFYWGNERILDIWKQKSVKSVRISSCMIHVFLVIVWWLFVVFRSCFLVIVCVVFLAILELCYFHSVLFPLSLVCVFLLFWVHMLNFSVYSWSVCFSVFRFMLSFCLRFRPSVLTRPHAPVPCLGKPSCWLFPYLVSCNSSVSVYIRGRLGRKCCSWQTGPLSKTVENTQSWKWFCSK